MRRLALLVLASLLPSCASDVAATGLAINDPLGLIDQVQGPLRLFVLPAESYACDATTGAVEPDVPDVGQGLFEEATADVELVVSNSAARTELSVLPGDYTVLVRGKGTDPVTGIRDTFIATGCAAVSISSGETVEIRITLIPIVGEGQCGDGTLSPDEQCEDGNTVDGDGCSSSCRTEPFEISTTSGIYDRPSIGGASGRRWAATFDNRDPLEVRIRLLEPDTGPVTFPSVLMNDASLGSFWSGRYALSDVAVASDGRIGMSFVQFVGAMRGVRIAFFDENRTPEANPMLQDDAGTAPNPSVAFAGDDTFLAVFENTMSSTGLSGALVPPGSTTPGSLFEIGESEAREPAVAGASDHFVVAFSAGGDVFFQRFDTDGEALDESPIAVLEDAAGTQDQPDVAALPDGTLLVTWRDSNGDDSGTAIRARAFGPDGEPSGPAFTLNTTSAGDQGAPSVAGAADRFVVAFESGSSVRARVVSKEGVPLPNREKPPTTADFEVAPRGAQPSVAIGGPRGDTWVVAWGDNNVIHARPFPLE